MKRFAACFALLFLAFAASAFDPEPYIREEIANIAAAQLREYHFYAGKKLPKNWENFSELEIAGTVGVKAIELTADDYPPPKTISEAKLMAKLCWDHALYFYIRQDWIVRERK